MQEINKSNFYQLSKLPSNMQCIVFIRNSLYTVTCKQYIENPVLTSNDRHFSYLYKYAKLYLIEIEKKSFEKERKKDLISFLALLGRKPVRNEARR